jgi:myosin heavy subunit
MLAAVLWLGNISFTVIDSENHVEAVTDEGKSLLELKVKSIFRIVICSQLDMPT